MKTAIVTDTNSGMSVAEGREKGIWVIPMPVIIDGTNYLEGEDITHQEVYAALAAGKNVTTSQASAGAVMAVFDEALKQADELVYIPMSSGLSGTCDTGKLLAAKYGGRVEVADNRRISFTLYESVLDAQYYAEQGASAAEIREKLEKDAYNAAIYITVGSVEYLQKSGRITPAGVTLASLLHIVPILTIQGGKLDAYKRVRGMKSAAKHMIEALKNDLEKVTAENPDAAVVIGSAGTETDEEAVEAMVSLLKKEFPQYPVARRPLSCSIASHTGPEASGVAWVLIDHPR